MHTRGFRQRGAALLLAMIIVALVATLASGMLWQQWRATQVEAAERARTQAGWILTGAMDWSRLILREDARADLNGRASRPPHDHLGEPWATPLAEARLSTFLAVDRERNTDDAPEAFLSGAIEDAQSRYNLRNLLTEDSKIAPAEMATLVRLCDAAGLPPETAQRVGQGLAASWAPVGSSPEAADRPLPVQRLEHLTWLGLDEQTVARLRPWLTVLPERTPVNVNTAPREVLAAVIPVDPGTAERMIQVRQLNPFETLDQVKPHLPPGVAPEASRLAVQTNFFLITGQLRLDDRVLAERALVQRRGGEAFILRRERFSGYSAAR